MKVLSISTRLYVSDMDQALSFYEGIIHAKPTHRFRYADIELAAIGSLLILAGSLEALAPFRQTTATFIVDSITEFKDHLIEQGSSIIRDIQNVPTGKNMTVRHPDETVIEYVELTSAASRP